ncbi:MAG: molybdenum cofactor biosynthesis protein MoaE [Planctomycetota bacterium]|nr:molybdenum cofactor biosynthesis protein MoaE [Planctomycetota bacterium]
MIEIVNSKIDSNDLLTKVSTNRTGAVVLFQGNTREFTAGKQTTFLSYECYHEMAEQKLKELREKAIQQWGLVDVAIVHRIGRVDPGETSVAIAVSSEHRKPAFEAGSWLIDMLKNVVPIWKQETWADGTTEWAHPQNNKTHSSSATQNS